MAQQGTVFLRNGSWYLQFWRTDFVQEREVRRRISQKLVRKDDEYRSKKDVRTRCAQQITDILAPINAKLHQPEGGMTFADFFERRFIPHLKERIARGERKPSLLKFYLDLFNNHLKTGLGHLAMRDVDRVDVKAMLEQSQSKKDLSRSSMRRIKTGVSKIFTYALENYRGIAQINPAHGVTAEGRKTKPERHAYSLDETLAMVKALPIRSATVVAVAAFTGLRRGELCGLQWADYDGENLNVCRSVWRTHITSPKTEASEDPVPIVPGLKKILDEYRKTVPNSPEAYIFAGEKKGAPLNLANLVRREMLPALEEAGCQWHGWHGFRRGLATRLHESNVQVETIQAILRHSDPKVTQDSYIVVKSDRARKAMRRVDDGEVLKAWRKSKSKATV
jgi:integrase